MTNHGRFFVFCFFLLLCSCSLASKPATAVATRGTVLFKDDFEDNTTGWDRLLNDHGIMDYDRGGYRILVKEPKLNIWSTPQKDFHDVSIEADVTRLNGPNENREGLMCRYQNGNYYFFIISNDGFYAIGKFNAGQTALLGQSEMQASALIQADSVNHLRADCVGNKLTFFVKATQVATVQDSSLASGDVGVLAGTFDQPGVDISFDNFVVEQP